MENLTQLTGDRKNDTTFSYNIENFTQTNCQKKKSDELCTQHRKTWAIYERHEVF